ncbi:MAG: hypothetical protein ACQESW_10620 [Bacteroidota bacterium]
MKIGLAKINERDGRVFLEAPVEVENQQRTLWFAVDRKYCEYLTPERLDAFLVGLLPAAMQRGEDIYVKGPVSERLYYHITRLFMKVLMLVIPDLKPIKIFAEELDPGQLIGRGKIIGTGFSGGIDSFCLLAEHLAGRGAPRGYEVQQLVYNHVGPPEVAVANQWQVKKLHRAAKDMDMPLLEIESNLDEFLSISFILSYVPRNLAAILAIQKMFYRYLFASSYSYYNLYIGPCHDIGHCHGVCLPLLSTENIEFVSSGEQYTRVEKTKIVSEFPPSYRALDICANYERNYEKNCSYCQKCLRTLYTLELLGKLDLYKEIFDVPAYHKAKNGYIEQLIQSNEHYELEIKALAKELHQRFPFPARLFGHTPFYQLKREARTFMPQAMKNLYSQFFNPVV